MRTTAEEGLELDVPLLLPIDKRYMIAVSQGPVVGTFRCAFVDAKTGKSERYIISALVLADPERFEGENYIWLDRPA